MDIKETCGMMRYDHVDNNNTHIDTQQTPIHPHIYTKSKTLNHGNSHKRKLHALYWTVNQHPIHKVRAHSSVTTIEIANAIAKVGTLKDQKTKINYPYFAHTHSPHYPTMAS